MMFIALFPHKMKKSVSCPGRFQRLIPRPQPPTVGNLNQISDNEDPTSWATPSGDHWPHPGHGQNQNQNTNQNQNQARLPRGRALVQTNTATESTSQIFNFILANARQFTTLDLLSEDTGYRTIDQIYANENSANTIEEIQWVRYVRMPYIHRESIGFFDGDTVILIPFLNNAEDFTLAEGGSINVELDNDSFVAWQNFDVGRHREFPIESRSSDLDLDFSTEELSSTVTTTRSELSTIYYTWSDEIPGYYDQN